MRDLRTPKRETVLYPVVDVLFKSLASRAAGIAFPIFGLATRTQCVNEKFSPVVSTTSFCLVPSGGFDT